MGFSCFLLGIFASANSSSLQSRRQCYLDGTVLLLVALPGCTHNKIIIRAVMPSLRPILLVLAALFAALVMASACETAPPVQEMSDARQAIAVAREAGAESHATAELFAAEQLLDSAEKKLNEQQFAAARRDAIQAKLKAQNARQLSEENQTGND